MTYNEAIQKSVLAETELKIEKAASRELLREIADLKLKHDYQVRRADSAEAFAADLRQTLDDTTKVLNDKLDELGLIKHILVEVGNGRFQKLDKPSPDSVAFIPLPETLPEGSAFSRPNVPNVPYSAPSLGGETVWPSLPKKERVTLDGF